VPATGTTIGEHIVNTFPSCSTQSTDAPVTTATLRQGVRGQGRVLRLLDGQQPAQRFDHRDARRRSGRRRRPAPVRPAAQPRTNRPALAGEAIDRDLVMPIGGLVADPPGPSPTIVTSTCSVIAPNRRSAASATGSIRTLRQNATRSLTLRASGVGWE
jgi:hypothetical protein